MYVKKIREEKTGSRISLCILVFLAAVFTLTGCGQSQGIEVTAISELEWSDLSAESEGQDQRGDQDSKGRKSEETGMADDAKDVSEGIIVYVRGAVKKPGVYFLQDGSRVYQAIDAAGGFTAAADRQWLNQAEILTDGEMLTVSTLEETSRMKAAGLTQNEASPAGTSTGNTSSSSAGGAIVNLNSATKEELMTLPGIGESKADSIIRYREENGPFASPEDVMNISGIKNSVYSKIKDRITV